MKKIRLPLLAGLALAVLLPFAMVTGTVAANVGTSALRPLTTKQVAHRLTGEVYGFLPYWLQTNKTAESLRYDLLTTVAFFDVGLTSNGSLDRRTSGYKALLTGSAAAVIQAAHAAGDRVDLTLASFGFAQNRAFLRNRTAQRRAITQVVALMAARGLDGVAVDLESVYRRDLPDFARFVDALGRAVRAHNRIGGVTVAVGASQAGTAMAAAALAGHADRVLIMGYDYRSGGSATTGSTDPLLRHGGGMSLTWTLDLFKAAKLPMNRIILALPYYGMSWPTTSAQPGTPPARAAYGKAPAYAIRVSQVQVPSGARHGYDPVEASAWVATYDHHLHLWRQTYYDSPQALAVKYAFARSRGLAGVGLWALGYDAGSAANWQALAQAFQPPPAKPPAPPKPHKPAHRTHKHHPKPKTSTSHKSSATEKPRKPAPVKVIHRPGPIAI
jgi:spore germination protein YaaH